MQTVIQKWGNSQGLRIPKAFLDAVGIVENDIVDVQRVGDGIVIKKMQPKQKLTLSDIFEEYDSAKMADQEVREYDWGAPVGKEVW